MDPLRSNATYQIKYVPPYCEAASTRNLACRLGRLALRIDFDHDQRDLHEKVLRRVFECILAELFKVVDRAVE